MRRYIAALAALMLPAGLMGQVLADKAPAGTVVYVGFRGTDALKGAYEASHLRGIAEGTDWDVVMSEKFQTQLAKLISRNDPELAEAWPGMFEGIRATWPHPSALCFGVRADGRPSMAVICEAGDDAAGVLAKYKDAVPPGSSIQAQQSGKYVVFTDQPDAVMPLLAESNAKAGLAGVPEFAAAMKQVDAQGAVTVFVNTKAIIALMMQRGDEEPRRMFAAMGLDQIQAVAASGNFAGKDWQNRVFVMVPGTRTGLAAMLDNKPISDATLKLVPVSATVAHMSHMDLARMLDTTRATMAKANPQQARDIDRFLQMANAGLGVNLEKDLFPALGDEWAMYTDPNVGGQLPMGMVAVNRLRDPAKAEAALGQLQQKLLTYARAGAEMKGMTVPASEKQIGGTKVHVIGLPMVTPSWAIRDGVLYIGLYPQTVAAAADFAASGKPSIAELPALNKAKQATGAAPQSIGYMDLPRAADAGYGFALLWSRYIGMLDLFGVETPVTPLPTLPVLKQNLSPVVTLTWSDAEGWHMQGTGPFPGGQLLGTMMTSDITGVQVPVAMSILLPSLARAREKANQVKCASNMRQIGMGIMLYAQDHKFKYPDELGDLLLEVAISPEVFICPSADEGLPEIVRQSPKEEQANWVNQDAQYVYLGAGMNVQNARPDQPILYERLEHHREGSNVLFADGHVEFVSYRQLDRIIAPAAKPAQAAPKK